MKALTLSCLLFFAMACGQGYAKQPDNQPSKSLLTLHNHARVQVNYCGRKKVAPSAPLRWNGTLAKVAKDQVRAMIKTKRLSHNVSGSIKSRVLASGYPARLMAENIAFGTSGAKQTFQQWMESYQHCLIILSNDYMEMGAYSHRGYSAAVYARKRKSAK